MKQRQKSSHRIGILMGSLLIYLVVGLTIPIIQLGEYVKSIGRRREKDS